MPNKPHQNYRRKREQAINAMQRAYEYYQELYPVYAFGNPPQVPENLDTMTEEELEASYAYPGQTKAIVAFLTALDMVITNALLAEDEWEW